MLKYELRFSNIVANNPEATSSTHVQEHTCIDWGAGGIRYGGFIRFARAIFIFVHFAVVLDQSTT